MESARRALDLVVFGATGYTGQLVAEHLAKRYGEHPTGPKWAMAGRSAAKLDEVRDVIGAPKRTSLFVANSQDPVSLRALAARARVVLSTVGPYQLHGEPLLRACIEAGTDYADLCGEPVWMRQMIDKYAAAARDSGARILFSCGFDSIPFDLGVLMLQKEVRRRFGAHATRIEARVRIINGKLSGGTAASLTATSRAVAEDPSLLPYLTSPFALTPGFAGPEQPAGDIPTYDETLASWAAPFLMAPINTKNIHRTNQLLNHTYGVDFLYDEMLLTGPGERGRILAKRLAETQIVGTSRDPEPGEGPSREERAKGSFEVLFIAGIQDGRALRYRVSGRQDPGYGSTGRMLAETGVALLSSHGSGGITTPGALLGEALVHRLRENAEIAFGVDD